MLLWSVTSLLRWDSEDMLEVFLMSPTVPCFIETESKDWVPPVFLLYVKVKHLFAMTPASSGLIRVWELPHQGGKSLTASLMIRNLGDWLMIVELWSVAHVLGPPCKRLRLSEVKWGLNLLTSLLSYYQRLPGSFKLLYPVCVSNSFLFTERLWESVVSHNYQKTVSTLPCNVPSVINALLSESIGWITHNLLSVKPWCLMWLPLEANFCVGFVVHTKEMLKPLCMLQLHILDLHFTGHICCTAIIGKRCPFQGYRERLGLWSICITAYFTYFFYLLENVPLFALVHQCDDHWKSGYLLKRNCSESITVAPRCFIYYAVLWHIFNSYQNIIANEIFYIAVLW